jgi:hypothetical protein
MLEQMSKLGAETPVGAIVISPSHTVGQLIDFTHSAGDRAGRAITRPPSSGPDPAR